MKRFWKKILVFFGVFIMRILYPVRFYHRENLPQGKAIFVCNHLSNVDSFYFFYIYKDGLSFLIKEELCKKRLARWFFSTLDCIPIDRENPSVSSIMKIVKILKNGGKLCIFPEGTRNKNGVELQSIKSGAGVFSVLSKCPIVPVMILKKPKLFKRSDMIFGTEFELAEYYGKKLDDTTMSEIDNIITDKMRAQYEILKSETSERKHKKSKSGNGNYS